MPDAIVSTRPVLTVAGQTWELVANNLHMLRFEEDEDGMARVEAHFDALRNDGNSQSFAFESDTPFRLGATFDVALGTETSPTTLFRGVISSLGETYSRTGAPAFRIEAEDPLQRARMTRRSAVYADATLGDVVDAVANRLGKSPRYDGLQASTRIGTQVQLNESDLAFLRRVLGRLDGHLAMDEDRLVLRGASATRGDPVELDAQGDFLEGEVVADLADQVSAVTVAGWDADAGEPISVRSRSTALGPGSGRGGASFLTAPFPTREEHVAHVAVATREEAEALAEAAWLGRSRGFVQVRATVPGNAAVRVFADIRLRGTSARFANTYRVVRAVHSYDLTSGYTTRFEAHCPWLADAR